MGDKGKTFGFWQYVRLYRLFWILVLRRESNFRGNFLTMLVAHISVLLSGLFGTLFFYLKVPTLAGWTLPEMLAFSGAFQLIDGIWMVFLFFNVMDLQAKIREGNLDLILLYPVDPQWWVTFWKPDIRGIMDIGAGIILLTVGLIYSHVEFRLINLVLFVLCVVSAVCIWYTMNFVFSCLAFWFTSVGTIFDISEGLYDIAARPESIYPKWSRKILLFAIPITVSVSIPAQVLVRTWNLGAVLWIFAAATLGLIATKAIWALGVHTYGSTGT